MTAKKPFKEVSLPPDLVEAWDEAYSEQCRPSMAGPMAIWLALTPDIRQQVIKAAYNKDAEEAIAKLRAKIRNLKQGLATMKKIKLGDVVKDVITNFEGVVVSRCDYITGCTHYGVTPFELKDGKPQDAHWIDEQRIEFVKKSGLSKSAAPKGGPQSHPSMDNPPS